MSWAVVVSGVEIEDAHDELSEPVHIIIDNTVLLSHTDEFQANGSTLVTNHAHSYNLFLLHCSDSPTGHLHSALSSTGCNWKVRGYNIRQKGVPPL